MKVKDISTQESLCNPFVVALKIFVGAECSSKGTPLSSSVELWITVSGQGKVDTVRAPAVKLL